MQPALIHGSAQVRPAANATGNLATVVNKAANLRGAASTDPRVSAGMSHAANAAGNLHNVVEEVTTEQGATSRDPRAKAGMSTAVNSVATRATAGLEGTSPMEQETAPGEGINKTTLFVKGVVNVRLFFKWLKEETGRDGSARMQGDKLVLVPKTADSFRATVKVLRSIDENKGVAFHTYSLSEDRCTRPLVKGLGKNMPEQNVREELEILGIPVQSVLQLRSQRRDPDPAKDRFPTPHFILTVARGPLSARCAV